jgi:hypothetical protein
MTSRTNGTWLTTGGVTRRRTVWRPSCCSRERDFRDINLTAEPPLFAAFIVRWVAPTSALNAASLRCGGVHTRGTFRKLPSTKAGLSITNTTPPSRLSREGGCGFVAECGPVRRTLVNHWRS